MTKKKQNKQQIRPLTPLEYIRTRARLLPIYKCYVNSDWIDSGLVNVIVARIHKNNNITFGIYSMESYERGLIITRVSFNSSENTLKDHLEHMVSITSEINMIVEIDYTLAHNIIYGIIAHAKEKGYKPDSEFDCTKYILEEDDGKIDKIKIDFDNNIIRIEYKKEEDRLNELAQKNKTS